MVKGKGKKGGGGGKKQSGAAPARGVSPDGDLLGLVRRRVGRTIRRAESGLRSVDGLVATKLSSAARLAEKRRVEIEKGIRAARDKQAEAVRRFRSKVEAKLEEKPVIKAVDKSMFTVTVLFVILVEAVLLTVPWRVREVYAASIVPLLVVRYVIYHGKHWHFFMLDFCYYTQLLLLFALFVYPSSRALAVASFVFSNGPLLAAVVAWRNSLVFHDVDKSTSLIIHLMPALVTFSSRWLPRADPSAHRSNPYSALDSPAQWGDVFLCLVLYLVWQVAYYCKTEVHDRRRLETDHRIQTSLRWLSDPGKKVGWSLKLGRMLGGPSHPWRWPFIIMFWQGVYTAITAAIGFAAHASFAFHAAALVAVIVVAVHNGANFYFERFAEMYMRTFEDVSFKDLRQFREDRVGRALSPEPPAAAATTMTATATATGTTSAKATSESAPASETIIAPSGTAENGGAAADRVVTLRTASQPPPLTK